MAAVDRPAVAVIVPAEVAAAADRTGGAGHHNERSAPRYRHFHPHLPKYRHMLTMNIQVIFTFR